TAACHPARSATPGSSVSRQRFTPPTSRICTTWPRRMAATTSPPPMTSTGSTAAPEPVAQAAPAGLWRAFCPAYLAASVCEIDPAWLEARGLRALILHLDNTLLPWHTHA